MSPSVEQEPIEIPSSFSSRMQIHAPFPESEAHHLSPDATSLSIIAIPLFFHFQIRSHFCCKSRSPIISFLCVFETVYRVTRVSARLDVPLNRSLRLALQEKRMGGWRHFSHFLWVLTDIFQCESNMPCQLFGNTQRRHSTEWAKEVQPLRWLYIFVGSPPRT